MTTVLVVDDVPAMAEQYAYDLRRLGAYQTMIAGGGQAALELVEREPVDVMILDLEMPGLDGFGVLKSVGRRVPVIVYTGTGSYDRCRQAVQLGAKSFLDKAEPMERVVREVEHVLERERLNREVAALRASEGDLVGTSPALTRLREQIARLAPIPSPVLILGESGSGKELVAREAHRISARRGPLVAVNCAALPGELVESELFGHERGAFTGAHALRKGAFESAAGGTLFLDEIGELPLPAQAKLLRVLEQREITRVGGNRTIPVDARVLAATNRHLDDEVRAGRFRLDLYYRLCVHVLRVPALAERRSDIPALVAHLIGVVGGRFGMRAKPVTPAALDALCRADWSRNNVRELKNVVERMLIAADGEELGLEHIPREVREAPAAETGAMAGTFRELKAEAERKILLTALDRNAWHITRTARELGLADHASLLKILRRHRIRRGGN
ncbi:MAG TPA: sigma-54 dependent transcriptional regulator [Gemmatimonadales bacterium]|nr:sigma-54 dependent transcriptional regulator [Gemmatimonadales bacterium]